MAIEELGKEERRTSRLAAFEIGGVAVAPGERRIVDLPVSLLSNHTPVTLSVHVAHGREPGPAMFVSAAVHGDEVLGVEIIRRLLAQPVLKRIKGTLLAVPVVNMYGFITHSRYLPDRRDLNRSFPGSSHGSLAGQLADVFMRHVVSKTSIGIDLHTAAIHRENLPQIRVSPGKPAMLELARAFGAPVILEAPVRPGTLRETAAQAGTDVLVFEAGEGLRFDELAIRAGVSGVLRVMKAVGMIVSKSIRDSKVEASFTTSTHWIRSPKGGIFRSTRKLGASVGDAETIGFVTDPFGGSEIEVRSSGAGLIIGRTKLPVVNQGDGLFHIARFAKALSAEQKVGRVEAELQSDPLFDEDEII